MMYYTGEGVGTDHTRAFEYLKKAADRNHVQAQYQCGWMYQHGEGTLKDPKKALKSYEEAVENGHVDALYQLGGMYDHGEGVKRDRKQDPAHIQRSRKQGRDKGAASVRMDVLPGRGHKKTARKHCSILKRLVRKDV